MSAASAPTVPPVVVVIASTQASVAAARSTVRSLGAVGAPSCLVVDVDRTYSPVGDERVVHLANAVTDLGLRTEAARAAATLEPVELAFYAAVVGATLACSEGVDVVSVVLRAGVVVVGDLRHPVAQLAHLGAGGGLGGVLGTDAEAVGALAAAAPNQRAADPCTGLESTVAPGAAILDRSLCVLAPRSGLWLSTLRGLAADWRVAPAALDVVAARLGGATVLPGSTLLGAWRAVGRVVQEHGRLFVDGYAVVAVDLADLDAGRPWTLAADAPITPRLLLSEHPSLAHLVDGEARVRRADGPRTNGRSPAVDLGAPLRSQARRAPATAVLPDLLGLGTGPDLESWALELVPPADPWPVARYLAAVRLARPDLVQAFALVPGPDNRRLARWALGPGAREAAPGIDAALLARAAEASETAYDDARRAAKAPLQDGVTLVGYLTGELGLGVSVRLVDDALRAVGVPTSNLDVGRDLASRSGVAPRATDAERRRTSLVCVNASETPPLLARLGPLLKSTRVVGMWYWELEEFPVGQHGGFGHVDEVWVATDFMRDAIGAVAPPDMVVRTVTPPLPQAGPDPGVLPDRLGIPTDRPWLLFTFDFFSSAERKNPLGLLEAFARAFADVEEAERPCLVIKTINGDRHPGPAERLRLAIAGRRDVLFLDTYLNDDERHVLVSHCTAYVSLHRAEGLGLTVAEAMAWGKPVITTAYGGVMQFCTPDNAILVNWQQSRLQEPVGPYDAGLVWAEPDLEQAATLIRTVFDEPERAARIGARAARDIRELHNPKVAGVRMREALEEGHDAWVARSEKERTKTPPGSDGAHAPESGRGRLARALTRGRRHDDGKPS